MKIDLENTVCVFDLDDTLYKEEDYHASGIRAALRTIWQVYGFDAQSFLPLYTPEESDSSNPYPVRFKLIQSKYPGRDCIYIGDNPVKDFLAPNRLGWVTFCLKGEHKDIYSQDTLNLDESYLPDHWLSELEELKEFI